MATKKATPKKIKGAPTTQQQMLDEQRQYTVHDAVRTLARAEQIKKDPKLMADVGVLVGDLKKATRGAPTT